ncbi:MAG: hypothetical protein RLZZ371_1940, partial [Pseudomonadota bacterium]
PMAETTPPELTAAPADDDVSPLAPFRSRVFGMLWTTWLVVNICMWMGDVAAAWTMTSLTSTPLWVALVQTAASLPVFLLGLPSGALADILDRRRYFLATQIWVAVVTSLLSIALFLDLLSPVLLLVLLFANGVGVAMRWPVFAAIMPELVPRTQLPAALALNGVSVNFSRIVGPLVAGVLIASVGSDWVFLINAVLSMAAAVVIYRWRREHKLHPLGRERLSSAIRIGVQYMWQSYHLKGVLVRTAIFFFSATALLALLPLLAKNLKGGGGTYTLLLAAMGAGAVGMTAFMPRLRRRFKRDALVLSGTATQALAMLVIAFTPYTWVAVLAMVVVGTSWITAANTLTVSAQMCLPDWVRARGMSFYQMAIMGATALGAAFWGQIATLSDVHLSVGLAAVAGLLAIALVNRLMPGQGLVEDLTPSPSKFRRPEVDEPPTEGHVMMTVEYRIDPERAAEFRELMQESRRSRLRHGALSWELLQDINEPGRFVEMVEDESWNDHLRRFERVTADDAALRDRKLAFHMGDAPPLVNRSIMESTR